MLKQKYQDQIPEDLFDRKHYQHHHQYYHQHHHQHHHQYNYQHHLPIFGDGQYSAVSLRSSDMNKPINI
ncbi:unnamed protein product [Rotaria sordida]|uniref:Uncharacterized protein n=1 Tax=Rotaria sordida TaxID=392033 RepID=A0A815WCE3_9BILA|nr:unnamed protein product [Rotaria sordida]